MRKVTADNFRLPQPLYGRQIKFYYWQSTGLYHRTPVFMKIHIWTQYIEFDYDVDWGIWCILCISPFRILATFWNYRLFMGLKKKHGDCMLLIQYRFHISAAKLLWSMIDTRDGNWDYSDNGIMPE